MNGNRIILAQFFDDIRQEVGNKLSLMGCYTGGEMVFEKLPAALPKLYAYVTAITPVSKPFEILKFRAYLNGDLLAEMEIPASQLDPSSHPRSENPDASRFSVTAVMAFTPLLVNEPCLLRIDAETGDGITQAGGLYIHGTNSVQ